MDPTGLELTEPCLPQPPKFWEQRHATPFPGYNLNSFKNSVSWFLMFCLWVFSLHLCVPWACRVLLASQKSLNLLELGLQTVVNCPVGAGNRTLVLSAEPSLQPPILAFLFFSFCFFWALHTAFTSYAHNTPPTSTPLFPCKLHYLFLDCYCCVYVMYQYSLLSLPSVAPTDACLGLTT